MDDKKLQNLLLMYGPSELRWSVLFIDVKQDRVEALVTACEALGLVTTAVLRDPDHDATRTHDAASLRARTLELEGHARAHEATLADWSARK